MQDIFKKYGYYKESQVSITLEGAEGAKKIKEIMDKMRNIEISKIGDYKVLSFRDIENNIKKDLKTGKITETGLPKSNVLYYELENDSWCCIRPSGTEPKIKVYFGIKGTSNEDAKIKLDELKQAMVNMI